MGVAALTQADLDDFTAGRVTQTDLAGRAGVSRQAVARFLKRRGVRPPTAPSAASAPTPSGASAATAPEPVDARAILTSASLGLLKRSYDMLAGADTLGPSALKALATTITTAADELRRLGVLEETGTGGSSALTIAIMTPGEVSELRQRVDTSFAEAGFASDDDETVSATTPHPPSSTAGHTLIPDLRERLERLADHKGAAAVRALALTIGAIPGRSVPSAIEAVMTRCMQDEASAAKVLEHVE